MLPDTQDNPYIQKYATIQITIAAQPNVYKIYQLCLAYRILFSGNKLDYLSFCFYWYVFAIMSCFVFSQPLCLFHLTIDSLKALAFW